MMNALSQAMLRELGTYTSQMRYCKYRKQQVVLLGTLNHILQVDSLSYMPALMLVVVVLPPAATLVKYLETTDGSIQYAVFHSPKQQEQGVFAMPRMYCTKVA